MKESLFESRDQDISSRIATDMVHICFRANSCGLYCSKHTFHGSILTGWQILLHSLVAISPKRSTLTHRSEGNGFQPFQEMFDILCSAVGGTITPSTG